MKNKMINNPLKNWFEKIKIDRQFKTLLIIILITGFVMAFSAYPYTRAGYILVKKFFVYSVLSLFAMRFFSLLDKKNLLRISVIGFASMTTILLALPVIGTTIKGSTRWLTLPFFNLQPSEVLKPFFCVLSTISILQIKNLLKKSSTWKDKKILKISGVYFITVSVILLSIMRQPDMGMTFTFIAILIVQLFVTGLKLKLLGIFGMISASVLIIGYSQLNHVRTRIDAFLFADLNQYDQQGIAIRVIKESGLSGGGNSSLLKQYVPDVHTDFIFTAFCESFGGIAAILLILILFMFIIRGFRLLRNYSDDEFKVILGSGILGFLCFQIIINLFSNLALLPPKGMILPFISYGGSGYLSASISVGILLSLFRIELPTEIQILNDKPVNIGNKNDEKKQ